MKTADKILMEVFGFETSYKHYDNVPHEEIIEAMEKYAAQQSAPIPEVSDVIDGILDDFLQANEAENAMVMTDAVLISVTPDVRTLMTRLAQSLTTHPKPVVSEPKGVPSVEDIKNYALGRLPEYSDNQSHQLDYYDGIVHGAKWAIALLTDNQKEG